MFNYRGYDLDIQADIDEEELVGKAYGIKSHILCSGKTIPELKTSFCEAVDRYLKRCEEKGKTPEKAFSGKIMLRTDSDTHRRIFLTAAKKHQSINVWLERLAKANVIDDDDDFAKNFYAVESHSKPKSKNAKKRA